MDNDFFSGFEPMPTTNMSNSVSSIADGDILDVKGDVTDLQGGNDPIVEPPVSDDDNDDNGVLELDEDGNPITPAEDDDIDDDDDDDTDGEDDDDEPAKPKRTQKKQPKQTQAADDDDDGLGTAEEEIAEYLQVQLFDRFNIDYDEESEDNFKSVDDVVNYLQETVKEASIPTFANDEVAYIDEYVRNGGNLSQYMASVYGDMNLETVNIEDEKVQLSIVRQDLKNQGLSETRINRKIERMEDTGTLAEEAEDALESLKEYKELQQETLLEQQQKAAEKAEQDNLAFVQNVQDELKGMESILGTKLTEKDKKDLLTYIFKPTREGVTLYQKDYAASRKNLLASAFFTMKGDKLATRVEKKAKSNAAKKLKTKLASKGKRGKDQTQISGNTMDAWGAISKQLRK